MDENKKKQKRMATWTIAIFGTIFAIIFAVIWLPYFMSGETAMTAVGRVFIDGWSIILIDLVLCVLVYIGYSQYLKRKK